MCSALCVGWYDCAKECIVQVRLFWGSERFVGRIYFVVLVESSGRCEELVETIVLTFNIGGAFLTSHSTVNFVRRGPHPAT